MKYDITINCTGSIKMDKQNKQKLYKWVKCYIGISYFTADR